MTPAEQETQDRVKAFLADVLTKAQEHGIATVVIGVGAMVGEDDKVAMSSRALCEKLDGSMDGLLRACGQIALCSAEASIDSRKNKVVQEATQNPFGWQTLQA